MHCETLNIKPCGKACEINSAGVPLSLYFPEQCSGPEPRPAVIVCPGGGYRSLSDREGEPVALRFAAAGFCAAVLHYSIGSAKFPTALLELASAVAVIRSRAAEWNISPDEIFVCGFSAGGHLCASLGTLWNRDFVADALGYSNKEHRPDGMILSYPVITSGESAHRSSFEILLGEKVADEKLLELVSAEKQVNSGTPPTFLWHTAEDKTVPVENSLCMASALAKHGIPFELHVFPSGAHGLALANKATSGGRGDYIVPECQVWPDMAIRWAKGLRKKP